ncbi:hypothetical protein MASR1M90_06170 [Desulfovibrionales bacterium]
MQQLELDFPLIWEYKIIALHTDDVHASLDAIRLRHGCAEPVVRGNQSSSGKYATYTVRTYVHSREHMETIAAAFGQCPGVRYLL